MSYLCLPSSSSIAAAWLAFATTDPDYTVRLDAAHVLAAAKSAQEIAGGT